MQIVQETKVESQASVNLLFSDFFKVDPQDLEAYGAYNISLVTDLPLFIDPFLLFGSEKDEYQKLHQEIIRYLKFLRDNASPNLNPGLIDAWYRFKEVHQNWFGFTAVGNKGNGLGPTFARSLNANLATVLTNFGKEKITRSSHLEKLCLIADGVGKDTISDFTTNLIKGYLAEYTQSFASKYIDKALLAEFTVSHAEFDYDMAIWKRKKYLLPSFDNDYVLLTPTDLLTRIDNWINRPDLIRSYKILPPALSDESVRAQVDAYFKKVLIESSPGVNEPTQKDEDVAAMKTIRAYPQLVDVYIRIKEENAEGAIEASKQRVEKSEEIFLQNFPALIEKLKTATSFYEVRGITYDESLQRAKWLKHVIENCDGYRAFYIKGEPLNGEDLLKVLYKMAWFSSPLSADQEVNNGRGPADFKVSIAAAATLVELKLARNTGLRDNLQKQVEIYQSANPGAAKIKIIIFFSKAEEIKLDRILRELKLENDPNIIKVDARKDNKPSASKA